MDPIASLYVLLPIQYKNHYCTMQYIVFYYSAEYLSFIVFLQSLFWPVLRVTDPTSSLYLKIDLDTKNLRPS